MQKTVHIDPRHVLTAEGAKGRGEFQKVRLFAYSEVNLNEHTSQVRLKTTKKPPAFAIERRRFVVERETGFEPATYTLARCRSTN